MAKLKSLVIQEKIDILSDEAAALQNVADEEKRDLNADEQKRWDEINDAETGELPKLLAQKKLAEKHEAEQKRLADLRSGNQATVDNQVRDIAPRPVDQEPVLAIPVGPRPRAFASREDAYRTGNWIAAALFRHPTAIQRCNDWGMPIQAAMTEGSNLTGGYLVPDEMSQAIIDLREQYGAFRQNVTVRPMASDTVTIPRRTSGLTAYHVGENTEITASDAGWDQVEVIAKKWGVLCKMSTELNEDSFVSMADILTVEMSYAFATKEDQCGFIGTGTSTYAGITGVVSKINDGNHAGSISSAASGNTSFETLDLTDFEAVVGKLPQYPGLQPKWHISKPGYYASMARLMDAAGGNTKSDVAGGTGLQFIGYPVVFNLVTNSTLGADTSAIKCLFGDLNMAVTMAERRVFTVALSTDRYFELDQIGIKATTRWGISVHDVGDSSNAGPVIALKTAGS